MGSEQYVFTAGRAGSCNLRSRVDAWCVEPARPLIIIWVHSKNFKTRIRQLTRKAIHQLDIGSQVKFVPAPSAFEFQPSAFVLQPFPLPLSPLCLPSGNRRLAANANLRQATR